MSNNNNNGVPSGYGETNARTQATKVQKEEITAQINRLIESDKLGESR